MRALDDVLRRKAALLLAVIAMASGCVGERREPPPNAYVNPSSPDPILPTDQVKDATAAIHLAAAHCFPREPETVFQAELQRDRWFVWADFKARALSADVAKRDGAVTSCTDLEL